MQKLAFNVFKKMTPFIVGIGILFLIASLANTGKYFGLYINRFSPCTQAPMTSFPCYGVYDIAIIIISIIIAIILWIYGFVSLKHMLKK